MEQKANNTQRMARLVCKTRNAARSLQAVKSNRSQYYFTPETEIDYKINSDLFTGRLMVGESPNLTTRVTNRESHTGSLVFKS